MRQFLYFCTSKAGKLRVQSGLPVSTFVLVKPVNSVQAGVPVSAWGSPRSRRSGRIMSKSVACAFEFPYIYIYIYIHVYIQGRAATFALAFLQQLLQVR